MTEGCLDSSFSLRFSSSCASNILEVQFSVLLHLDCSDPEPPEHTWKDYHFQRFSEDPCSLLDHRNSGAIPVLVEYTCKIGKDSAG